MGRTLFALVDNLEHAENSIVNLQQLKFDNQKISILFLDRLRSPTESIVEDKTIPPDQEVKIPKKKTNILESDRYLKMAEKANTFTFLIEGPLAQLAGICSLAIPNTGVYIVAGPILALLNLKAANTTEGILAAALSSMGLAQSKAIKWENILRNEKILICLHESDSHHLNLAKKILQKEFVKEIEVSLENAGMNF